MENNESISECLEVIKKQEVLIAKLEKEIRELKETTFICPVCKIEKPIYLRDVNGKCYECNALKS